MITYKGEASPAEKLPEWVVKFMNGAAAEAIILIKIEALRQYAKCKDDLQIEPGALGRIFIRELL